MTQRHCLALDLKEDPELIAQYERHHSVENAWPAVTAGLIAAGVESMEIYRFQERLFMIMEVCDDFDPHAKARADTADPEIFAWEALMEKFQKRLPGGDPDTKWQTMTKIYDLAAVRPAT